MGREKRPGAPAQGGVTRPTPGGFGEGAARAGHRADAGAGPSETTNAGLAGLSRTSVQVALDRQKRRAQFRQVQAGAGAEDGRGKRTRRGALAGPGADAVLVAGAHDTGAAGGPGAGWLERGGEPTARDRVLRALERRTEADDDMAALTAEVLAGVHLFRGPSVLLLQRCNDRRVAWQGALRDTSRCAGMTCNE